MRHDKRRDRDAACDSGRNAEGPYENPQASASGEAPAAAGAATARAESRAGHGAAPAQNRRHQRPGHGKRGHQASQRQRTPHRSTRAGDGATASTRRASAMLSSVPESVQDPRRLRPIQLCTSTAHSSGMRWQSSGDGAAGAAHGWTQDEPIGRSTSPRQVAGHQLDEREDEARTSFALSFPGGCTFERSPTTSESARSRQSAPRPFDNFSRDSEAELASEAKYLESIIDVLGQPSPTAGAKALPFTSGPDAYFSASSSNASPFSSKDNTSLPAPEIPSNKPPMPASSVSSNVPGNSAQASVHQEQHLPPTRLVPYFQPHYQPFHPQPPVPNYYHGHYNRELSMPSCQASFSSQMRLYGFQQTSVNLERPQSRGDRVDQTAEDAFDTYANVQPDVPQAGVQSMRMDSTGSATVNEQESIVFPEQRNNVAMSHGELSIMIRGWKPPKGVTPELILKKSEKEFLQLQLQLPDKAAFPLNRCRHIMQLGMQPTHRRTKESVQLIERACVLFITHLTLLAKHFRGERDNFILQERDVVHGTSMDPSMDFLVRVFMLNQPDSIASAIASHPGNAVLLEAREMVTQHNSRRKNNARDRPGAGDENDSNENDGESSAAELLDSVHIQ